MTAVPGSEHLSRRLMGKRHLVHPTRRRLQAWLDDSAPDLDEHLATCARCADRLDEVVRPTGPLTEVLLAALAPPADLQSRLRAGIAVKMQNRDDLMLLTSMLGVGWETLRTLAEPPDDIAGAGD